MGRGIRRRQEPAGGAGPGPAPQSDRLAPSAQNGPFLPVLMNPGKTEWRNLREPGPVSVRECGAPQREIMSFPRPLQVTGSECSHGCSEGRIHCAVDLLRLCLLISDLLVS